MASGHVNRANRGRTHGRTDQCCRREEIPCQLGAVHTWPVTSLAVVQQFSDRVESGHRADTVDLSKMTLNGTSPAPRSVDGKEGKQPLADQPSRLQKCELQGRRRFISGSSPNRRRLVTPLPGRTVRSGEEFKLRASKSCDATALPALIDDQLFGGHLCPCDAVCYLLECDVARIVRTAVVWLLVKRRRGRNRNRPSSHRCLSIYLAPATN